MADGGEGTMDALVGALGGELREATVPDPLGRPVEARFALLPDGSAVVETAQASGLGLVSEDERDAWAASTRGTGELIAAATEAGAERVIVTVGGSATTDGGAGALEALAEAGLRPELDVLCDVRTPFEHAPSVFGPQKGADPEMVERLEERLEELARSFERDPRGEPMTGAAGGLSGGLFGALGARLVPGAAYVLDAIGFDDRDAGVGLRRDRRGPPRRPDAPGQGRGRGGHALPPGAAWPATRWWAETGSTRSRSASSTSPRSRRRPTSRSSRRRAGRSWRGSGSRPQAPVRHDTE